MTPRESTGYGQAPVLYGTSHARVGQWVPSSLEVMTMSPKLQPTWRKVGNQVEVLSSQIINPLVS
jgi:hypothetical protein